MLALDGGKWMSVCFEFDKRLIPRNTEPGDKISVSEVRRSSERSIPGNVRVIRWPRISVNIQTYNRYETHSMYGAVEPEDSLARLSPAKRMLESAKFGAYLATGKLTASPILSPFNFKSKS